MVGASPDPVESTLMVCDYIWYRLKLAEIDWEYRPENWLPGREHLMLRELAYSFELRYKTKLEKLINKMEFSLNSIQDEYQEILDWLLGKRITWKRIILMFSITGYLALESVVRKKPSNVIVFMETLLSLYIDKKLFYWVLANGDWENGLEKFLRHYSNTQTNCCIII